MSPLRCCHRICEWCGRCSLPSPVWQPLTTQAVRLLALHGGWQATPKATFLQTWAEAVQGTPSVAQGSEGQNRAEPDPTPCLPSCPQRPPSSPSPPGGQSCPLAIQLLGGRWHPAGVSDLGPTTGWGTEPVLPRGLTVSCRGAAKQFFRLQAPGTKAALKAEMPWAQRAGRRPHHCGSIWPAAGCGRCAGPCARVCVGGRCGVGGRPHVATARAHGPWILCSTVREATMIRSPHATTGEQLLLAATREKPTPQQRPSTAT